MTARMPRRVKLGGSDWTLARVALDADLDLFGRTTPRESRIEIDRNQSPAQERETVLHELLHAVGNAPNLFGPDHETEERQVSALAPWLLAMLRDNPALVAYLTERDA